MNVVILGLSVTSSWGNGHATTYRSLIRGLAARGHRVTFLERDAEWYAGNRDEPHPFGARTELYDRFEGLTGQFEGAVSHADLVIVGSFVPEGRRVAEWVQAVTKGVTAFYDIDTPVTIARLEEGSCDYLDEQLIRRFHLYLSFTGGPTLRKLESRYGSPMARELYCSVDPRQYRPDPRPHRWDLGYLGTYSDDRQPALDSLLLEPARRWEEGRFAVVGPMYPDAIPWPANLYREIHLSPSQHPAFYGSQRCTLNITRAAMKQAGFSPSVRLFEAGACGVPIISDWWEGLDSLFEIGREVLISSNADDTMRWLRDFPEASLAEVGDRARRRILSEHTPETRARQLERYVEEVHDNLSSNPARRNRRGGNRATERLASGMESQLAGKAPGREAGGPAGAPADPGGIHQSTGAGD